MYRFFVCDCAVKCYARLCASSRCNARRLHHRSGKLRLARFAFTQFLIVRPIIAFLYLVIREYSATYAEGQFAPRNAWGYLKVADVVSTLCAIVGLLCLHQLVADQIPAAFHVGRKFVCVKALLIVIILQETIISLVESKTRALHHVAQSPTNAALLLQAFVVAIESLPGALPTARHHLPRHHMRCELAHRHTRAGLCVCVTAAFMFVYCFSASEVSARTHTRRCRSHWLRRHAASLACGFRYHFVVAC